MKLRKLIRAMMIHPNETYYWRGLLNLNDRTIQFTRGNALMFIWDELRDMDSEKLNLDHEEVNQILGRTDLMLAILPKEKGVVK